MTEKTNGICCPDCGCRHLFVNNTIQIRNGVKRYRECRHCGKIIVTREKIKEIKQ